MGMYNEVYKKCPVCKNHCEIQIPELVQGFGCFNLDSPESLADKLNEEQLHKLKNYCDSKTFYCHKDKGGCGANFEVSNNRADRVALAKRLFGEE